MNRYRCIAKGAAIQHIDVQASNSDEARQVASELLNVPPAEVKVVFLEYVNEVPRS